LLLCPRISGAELEPLQCQPRLTGVDGTSQHVRYTHRLRGPQGLESRRLGRKHGVLARVSHFHKQRPQPALPPIALIDRATVHAGGRRGTELSSGDRANPRCQLYRGSHDHQMDKACLN
jgi:hypothetical protein